MRHLIDHHHYRLDRPMDRVARIEREVFDRIVSSSLPDGRRDSSICWEMRHHASTTQLARLLAQKRALEGELCAAAMALHDIYAALRGEYKDHARLGVPIAREILEQNGGFDTVESELILGMIGNHSDKHIYSDDPYVEFCKDADLLDCFLYPHAEDYYLSHKPLASAREYFRRWNSVRAELGLQRLPRYEVLDAFEPGWLKVLRAGTFQELLATAMSWDSSDAGICAPALFVFGTASEAVLMGSPDDLQRFLDRSASAGALVVDGLAEFLAATDLGLSTGAEVRSWISTGRRMVALPPVSLAPAGDEEGLVALWLPFRAFTSYRAEDARPRLVEMNGGVDVDTATLVRE